jgi:putative endonuclease
MKHHTNYANHINIGRMGECIVANYYKKKGHTIIEQNYRKKFGEIDVISRMNGKIYFIEVKTVSYETRGLHDWAISHETWRPEENVTYKKYVRICKTIDVWLHENKSQLPWQIDIAAVRIVPHETFSTINIISNVIFD